MNGGCEVKKALVIIAGLFVMAGGLAVSSTISQAATSKMTITGSVVSGVKSVQNDQDLVFSFTDTNTGTTANTNNIFYFTFSNSSGVNIVCPLANGMDINPDGNDCEPGNLPAGKSAQAAIIVQATGPGPIVVKACVGPTGTSVCKSLTVRYVG
jgi:hypothetical protein